LSQELLRSVFKEELQPIHERLARLEEGQLRLEQNQQRLEERQQRLEEKLDNFIIETRSHFKKVEDELEQHRRMFNKWKNIEIDIDYLSAKTGKHDIEINKLKKKLEFVQL
jgi:exonuclease VII large subunit